MTTNEKQLREMFDSIEAEQATKIRDSYYKAIESLQGLVHALEVADAESSGPTLLTNEQLLAAEALKTMKKSELGSIL